jgi:hypothetical protein
LQVLEARYLQLRDILPPSELDIALEKIRSENEVGAQFEANMLKKLLFMKALIKERIQH